MQVEVKKRKSIAVKLFALTTLLVVGSVTANSWLNTSSFKTQLDRQMEGDTLALSDSTAESFSNTIRNWELQLRVAVATSLASNESQRLTTMQNFLQTNENFVNLQLFKRADKKLTRMATANGVGLTDEKAGVKDAKGSLASLSAQLSPWLEKQLTQVGTKQYALINLDPKVSGLPAIVFVRKFESLTGAKDEIWAALTILRAPLTNALNETMTRRVVVLDMNGVVFLSKRIEDYRNPKTFQNLDIVKMATKGGFPAAFKGGYRDQQGKEWLGAYTKVSRFDYFVVVQEDAKVAYAAINSIIKRTLIVAVFFLFFAVGLSYLGAEGVTGNLKEVTAATQRIASGDFSTFLKVKTEDEVGVLAGSVNTMAQQIKQLLQSQVERARFEKELETANAVQKTLFPKEPVFDEGIKITGFSKPATECGGDWWGHFTSKTGIEYVFVADAMGHGVPAALVTAMAYSSFMTLANLLNEREGIYSPKRLLEEFNRVLYEAVRGTISMTVFAMAFDVKNRKMTFANAGHNFPVLIPRHKTDPRIDKKSLRTHKDSDIVPISLSVRGSVLGVEKETDISELTWDLCPGDRIVLFTDGLIECTNPKKEAWGRKVLYEKIKAAPMSDPKLLTDHLVKEAYQFFENYPQDDDITVVVVEYPDAVSVSQAQEKKEREEEPLVSAVPTLAPEPVLTDAVPMSDHEPGFSIGMEEITGSREAADDTDVSLSLDVPAEPAMPKLPVAPHMVPPPPVGRKLGDGPGAVPSIVSQPPKAPSDEPPKSEHEGMFSDPLKTGT